VWRLSGHSTGGEKGMTSKAGNFPNLF